MVMRWQVSVKCFSKIAVQVVGNNVGLVSNYNTVNAEFFT